MPDDEEQIRTLIERWAAAVHSGDLDAVVADHADDIVMFDVPPPEQGVRGLDAYRETWPPFFEWQARGAAFEIESLDVTAGGDVAYAHALLRCGTRRDLAERPANRLRLTLGLRKEDGRWIVAHEHHSFPDASAEDAPARGRARGPRLARALSRRARGLRARASDAKAPAPGAEWSLNGHMDRLGTTRGSISRCPRPLSAPG